MRRLVRRGGRARRLAHCGRGRGRGNKEQLEKNKHTRAAVLCCGALNARGRARPRLRHPRWRQGGRMCLPNVAGSRRTQLCGAQGGPSSWRRRVSRTCLSSPPISECTGAYLHRQRRVLAAPVAAGLREVVCVCMCVCGWGAMFPSALALACPRCSLTAGPSFLCAASFFYLQEARAAAGAARGAAAGWQCGDEGCDRPRREAGAPAATRSGAGFEAGAAGRC